MKFKVFVLMLIALLALQVSCSQKEEKIETEPISEAEAAATTAALEKMALTGVEAQLVDTLLGLWRDRSNITSVNQAADMIGADLTDSMRIELIDKFRANRGLSKRLSTYGPYTIVLSNKEKLIGDYIVRYQKTRQQFPAIDTVVAATGFSKDDVVDRLKFFADIDFLFDLGGPTESNPLGYSFGDRMAEVIYNTGLHYHTFYVKGRKPFNVCCAKEAFHKLLSQYPDRKVRYETYDPFAVQPITLEFENGQITKVSPESTQFLEGGYCVANCLFVSHDDAATYVASLPFVQNHQIMDPRQRLELLKQERASASSGN